MEWIQLVRGSVSVFDAALSAIQESKTARIFSIIHSSPSSTDPNFAVGTCDCSHFSYLLSSEDFGEGNGEQLQPPKQEVYRSTVAYINSVLLAIEAREHPAMICRRLMVFPLIVSQEFLKLLQEMGSCALVILAHYFALSATFTDIWWIGHTAHREVLAIEKRGQWAMDDLNVMAAHYSRITLQNMYTKLIMDLFDHLRNAPFNNCIFDYGHLQRHQRPRLLEVLTRPSYIRGKCSVLI
jgi:hypothetical protein